MFFFWLSVLVQGEGFTRTGRGTGVWAWGMGMVMGHNRHGAQEWGVGKGMGMRSVDGTGGEEVQSRDMGNGV